MHEGRRSSVWFCICGTWHGTHHMVGAQEGLLVEWLNLDSKQFWLGVRIHLLLGVTKPQQTDFQSGDHHSSFHGLDSPRLALSVSGLYCLPSFFLGFLSVQQWPLGLLSWGESSCPALTLPPSIITSDLARHQTHLVPQVGLASLQRFSAHWLFVLLTDFLTLTALEYHHERCSAWGFKMFIEFGTGKSTYYNPLFMK